MTLRGVWAQSETEAWAVGAFGTVLRYVAGGRGGMGPFWVSVRVPTHHDLHRVQCTTARQVQVPPTQG